MDPTPTARLDASAEDADALRRRVLRRPIEPPERWAAVAGLTLTRVEAGTSRSALLQELATSVTEPSPGPGASAVLCAEPRPKRISAKLRLAVRDRRYPDDPRRAT